MVNRNGGSMINIMIADDHILIREGLKKLCEMEADLNVVCDTDDPYKVTEMIIKNDLDLLLLDLNLPGKSGLEVLKEIKIIKPELKVLILSVHPEERYAMRTLKSGASGYISKDCAPQDLLYAIRQIAQGKKYISAGLAEQLALDLGSERTPKNHELLSDREFQVLRLISEGKSQHEISDILLIGVSTVNTYRSRILEKLNLKSNADIIYYAIENKLVD